ncbi:MAG: DUF342 domain-containing protein [Lachnospiraceae bacterium]|nr:DUF342 domain-containing protein [Lachnospiraceae bacterium]
MSETARGFIKVLISEDSMQARLCLATNRDQPSSEQPVPFTRDNVLTALSVAGVKAGIKNEMIDDMIESRTFDAFRVVAEGKPPLNGVSGSYKYHFNTEHNNKPKVLEDGSVDYHTIEGYEPVSKDALIVTYTPATNGHFGFNVRGAVIPNVKGKELPRLSGSGFHTNENNTEYYADVDGKVELGRSGELIVSNVLEIKGDVDLTTGDVIFNGDVIISGNVVNGLRIDAAGDVTINGNVEGAVICSGGDITMKLGMQGGGRGVIKCGGCLFGKFFEQVKIEVTGDLHASSMMNCDVSCSGNIYVTGRHGILVGGNISCQGNVEATIIGNLAEVKTYLNIGITEQNILKMNELEKTSRDLQDKIGKHTELKSKLELIRNPANANELATMKQQVEASLNELHKRQQDAFDELEQLKQKLAAFSSSKVVVHKYLYPNVKINISGAYYTVTSAFVNLVVKNVGGEIQLYNEP